MAMADHYSVLPSMTVIKIKGQLEEFQSSHYISLILVKDKEKLVKAKEFFHDKTYYYIINAMI